jgi:lysophospholipase L1-like esterase
VTAAAWEEGFAVTPYNLGVRRETSEQVVARIEAEALPRLTDVEPCRLVLSFGANDATVEDGRVRVEPGASVAALRRGLGVAERLGLPAFVVGPPPVADPAHAERIAALSARLAAGCTAPYLEVAARLLASGPWMEEARAGDGAHPGAAGYTQLAAIVRAPFLRWLRSEKV